MGVIHKCLLGAAAALALSCQPRWVYSASYQFANNTQLVQYDALTILKYKGIASLGQYYQILIVRHGICGLVVKYRVQIPGDMVSYTLDRAHSAPKFRRITEYQPSTTEY